MLVDDAVTFEPAAFDVVGSDICRHLAPDFCFGWPEKSLQHVVYSVGAGPVSSDSVGSVSVD